MSQSTSKTLSHGVQSIKHEETTEGRKIWIDLSICVSEEPCERDDRKHSTRLVVPLGPFVEQRGLVEGASKMGQQITLTDSQQVSIGPVSAVDKRGNAVPLGGPITFTSSDEAIVKVTPDADPATPSALLTAVGPVGNAQVTVSDGSATAVLQVAVIAGAEAGLTVSVGTPAEQPG